MTASQDLDAVLDRAEAAAAFGPGSPPDPQDLAAAREARPMPPPLARLYARANGLIFERVEVFDLADYEDVNGEDELFALLPGVVFFGSDGADGWFLLDPDQILGGGPDSVYWSERGALTPDECRLAAPDLAGFLSQALAGAALNDGLEVGQLSLERLFEALAAHPDQAVVHPGYGDPEALLAARERDLPIPFGLIDFYARCDGLYLKPLELEVYGLADLRPVEESQTDAGPGALWFAADRAGRRYAVTCGGWRGLPENRLIMTARPEEVGDAATLGRFTDVLRVWLETAGESR
ncbi:SMI1/KNR4 family protein [Phenylobacterium terrae]|uniref:SMI1/KNR4 family protein n=1 Tax=Phenylobacterium terrae TaxID=2665495 RepID=A0ABW4MVQ1_9CAUL